ncbi:Ada metal-binding domain-containing protein [Ferruginibacter sp.]|nr:metal-binding protein [Ferruginibacter sp.]
MIKHNETNPVILRSRIRKKEIVLAGNRKLKIYGSLSCRSGKRMHNANRVFFESENSAVENEYRPCGHCMKEKYKNWKDGFILYPN